MLNTPKNKRTAVTSNPLRQTNKLLVFAQRRIPYLPELKAICGSVCASIIMQQLEYWFASYPNGFYKFLQPCNHERYVKGDSWTEELCFTRHEFRTGFDKIGVRYKSKKQLSALLEKEETPFQGRFYLSYIDVRSGLTRYHRNHGLVDHQLTQLLTDYQPSHPALQTQTIDFNGDPESGSPDVQIVDFQKAGSRISRNPDSGSLIKDTKKNNKEEHTKRTAAITEVINDTDAGIAAADLKNKRGTQAEGRLRDSLTESQRHYIHETAVALSTQLPNDNAQQLEVEIVHTMLDPHAFTQAGHDFFKKINTIRKTIRDGRWTPPIMLEEKNEKRKQQKISTLQEQLRELNGNYQHLKKMLEFLNEKEHTAMRSQLQQQVLDCEQQCKQVTQALSVIHA